MHMGVDIGEVSTDTVFQFSTAPSSLVSFLLVVPPHPQARTALIFTISLHCASFCQAGLRSIQRGVWDCVETVRMRKELDLQQVLVALSSFRSVVHRVTFNPLLFNPPRLQPCFAPINHLFQYCHLCCYYFYLLPSR